MSGTVVALTAALVASGCSAAAQPGPAVRFSAAGAAPLPATQPYIDFSGSSVGWLTWPAGDSWLLLRTSDRFRDVIDRTPVAVPTDGGLVGSFADGRAAVAVGSVERLLRSPVLTGAAGAHSTWRPAELPAAVADSRSAVSLASGRLTVVTKNQSGGALLARRGARWTTTASATTLAGGSGLTLDGITWAGPRVGWLTGHGRAGVAMAFRTDDGGSTWQPVAAARGTAVAALAPCRAGADWVLPVLDADGRVTLFHNHGNGQRWTGGTSLRLPAGEPAWGCEGHEIWMAARSGVSDHVFASADAGRTWSDRGPAPAGLSDLTPLGSGDGLAASGGEHPRLWSVSADGRHFTPIALPPWVSALGQQATSD